MKCPICDDEILAPNGQVDFCPSCKVEAPLVNRFYNIESYLAWKNNTKNPIPNAVTIASSSTTVELSPEEYVPQPKTEEETIPEEDSSSPKENHLIKVVLGSIVLVIVVVVLVVKVAIPNQKYNEAVELMNNGQYNKAIEAFEAMNGYKDSEAQIENCQNALKNIEYYKAIDLVNNGQYKEAIVAFEAMDGYVDSETQIENCQIALKEIDYYNAIQLVNKGQYNEAIAAFEKMDGYKDSKTQIENCQTALKEIDYYNAIELVNKGQYKEAIATFESMDGYKDSETQIENCQTALKDSDYFKAIELMNNGQYTEAIHVLNTIDGYKDSDELKDTCRIKNLSSLDIGDIFYYGNYNDRPLSWKVLDIKDNKVFAIAAATVGERAYNEGNVDVTWSSCGLRTWLNDDFYNEAFSSTLQSRILTTTVNPGINPDYSTNAGSVTEDMIFLLSIDEANHYLDNDSIRNGTTYLWWLRSPGSQQNSAAIVLYGREVSCEGNYVGSKGGIAVRPAMWLSLE